MLAKMTVKNQITIPKAVTAQFGDVPYFDVAVDNNRITLTPVRLSKSDAVRSKLALMGITEQHVKDAIVWARARTVH
jgi:bifunctional DNA-binding transcriptional regulator/antitoxin component of YhaV-PrlF toxin-antitoxin module